MKHPRFGKYLVKRILQLGLTLSIIHYPLSITKAQTLSPSAKVSLLTIGPGEELYSSFGHSSLWISDPATGLDRNYNYGSFNFKTDNFYVKFLRGKLPYQIAVYSLALEMPYWQAENRSITEQELNLSLAQKQRLCDLLETNYLPQNREYAYKFFYDNCSTRLRDMLQAACSDSLQFSNQTVAKNGDTRSYRDWMNDYLKAKPWARLGMNIAIGLPSDRHATPAEEMYLPNNLKDQTAKAKLGNSLLAKQEQKLFEARAPEKEPFWTVFYTPSAVFAYLFFLIMWLTIKKPTVSLARFDKLFFGFIGFCGCFVLLLWVGTDHGVTNWNQNLLWLMPLHLPFAFMLGKPKFDAILRPYVLTCLVLCMLAFVACIIGFLNETQWIPISTLFFFPLLINRLEMARKKIERG